MQAEQHESESFRFPRSSRVLARRDFERAVKQGRRLRCEFFSIAVYQRGDGRAARLGLSATRRLGGAVVRNKAKRRARAVFRRRQQQLVRGLDLILLFFPPAAECAFAVFEAELLRLLRRAGCMQTADGDRRAGTC